MRKSPQTGLIHYNYSSRDTHDTIPIVENLCHVLELLQTKKAENLYEAKFLLEKLLHFQAPSGNFPQYLHEYPHCYNTLTAFDCLAPLHHIQKQFHAILSSIPLQKHIDRLHTYCQNTPHARPHQQILLKAALGEPIPASAWQADRASAWEDLLIASTLLEKPISLTDLAKKWDQDHFVGLWERYEKDQQQPTLVNLFLGQEHPDHPISLKKSLVQPVTLPSETVHQLHCENHHFRYGHLSCRALNHTLTLNDTTLTTIYPELMPDKPEKQMELRFYYPHDERTLPATTFQLGETISMGPFLLRFELVSGSGTFYGHISRGNRPSQLDKTYPHDWEIGLRTVRRSGPVTIQVYIHQLGEQPCTKLS